MNIRINLRPQRRTFHVGRIAPKPKPCNDGFGPHEGPLLDCEIFTRAGGMWANMGICAACLSTIHRSHLKGAVA